MQPTETISFKALLHCGVYALVRRGTVVYVGKSKKLWIRLYAHCNARGKMLPLPVGYNTQKRGVNFDDIWVWPCMLGQLDTLEVHLIRKYVPKYNVKDKPNPVIPIPEDIRAILKQMITITGLPPLEDRPKVYIRRLL